jgi:hypothetical protein
MFNVKKTNSRLHGRPHTGPPRYLRSFDLCISDPFKFARICDYITTFVFVFDFRFPCRLPVGMVLFGRLCQTRAS